MLFITTLQEYGNGKGSIANMKKSLLCCLLLLGCVLVTSCNNETKSQDVKTKEVVEEQRNDYKEIEELAGSSNQNTYNYLVYSQNEEISLHFGTDLSQLDIVQVDLYHSSELCYKNVLIEEISDNVIKIALEKFVPAFNYIVVHDSDGKTMTFYTGEFYLEEESGTLSKTKQIVKNVHEESDENSVMYTCTLEKKYRKDYTVQVECPQSASSYFTKKKTQNETSTIITYELKEEYKNSLKIAVDFQVLITFNATGESFVDMISYEEFNSNTEIEATNIQNIYVYKQEEYEKVDMQDELAIKTKEVVRKILKENAVSLETIDGSIIWGKAEEKKKMKGEECYIEIVFKNKETVNVTDEVSYNNITAMLVNVSENAIYLSQEENVLESGNFGIGLAVPEELMEEYFYDMCL